MFDISLRNLLTKLLTPVISLIEKLVSNKVINENFIRKYPNFNKILSHNIRLKLRKVHILYDLHKKLREKKIEHTEIFMNIKDKKEFSKKNATKVMDEDWDYLIILDACRYDAFCEYIGFEVEYKISYGSSTPEWILHNFNGKWDDVIFVSGNPHLSQSSLNKVFSINPFFKIYDVWNYGWDAKMKSVPPWTMTDEAIHISKIYPEKRMIIHYMQPHHPFLGDLELIKLNSKDEKYEKGEPDRLDNNIWYLIINGIISKERAWKAYFKNLKIVMKEVERLIEHLNGKIVISSDHGNHFGEYGLYCHNRGVRTEELVKVPWFIPKENKKVMDEKDLINISIRKIDGIF